MLLTTAWKKRVVLELRQHHMATSLLIAWSIQIGNANRLLFDQAAAMDYFVWNMFCSIPLGATSEASSRAATSAEDMRQPKAPRASSACLRFFAPGIGIVSLHKHQLMATCKRTGLSCLKLKSAENHRADTSLKNI